MNAVEVRAELPPVAEETTTPLHAYRERLPYPVWILYRAMRTVAVASAFAGFWTGGVLLSLVVFPVLALLAKDPVRACQRVLRASFRLFHGYMRLLRLFDAKPFRLELARPCVIVANHTTLVDVTAILSQVPDVCCVAKDGLAQNRLLGGLFRLAGFLPAGGSLVERSAMMSEAKAKLAAGFHVLVFPEGTRSPERSLLPFHRGAFEIACQSDVPVVPLLLRCDPSALRKNQRFWQQPDTCANLTIEVDPPVLPAAYEKKSRTMRRDVESHYRSRLGVRDLREPGRDS